MRIEDIQEHLDKYNDYDIRQNKNCRFVDQKCTPDVVCFIADCILSTDCATKAFGIATEVHHIFPKSQFPMIASYYENLILLTSSQHRQKAHPKGNTQVVDRDYQLTCLMAKSQTIEASLNEGNNFYRKESFIYVVNTGLDEHIEETISFVDIRKFLVNKYLEF